MQLNDILPEFTLKGTDDKMHSVTDYNGKYAIVIIFTCNHCPYARAYVERINAIVSDYEKRNAGFFAINPNDVSRYPEDSFEKMIPMGKLLNLHGKYLYDETQQTAKAFSAERTPEAFVFNKQRRLAYHGAIDDNADYKNPRNVSRTYLKDALDAALSGTVAQVQETPPVGCSIKWKLEAISNS